MTDLPEIKFGPQIETNLPFSSTTTGAQIEGKLVDLSSIFSIEGRDKLWCIEVIAPFGGHKAVLKGLKANVFAEREISYLWNEDGKGVVKRV